MKFKDLKVGDSFDFIGANFMLNSFYEKCVKVSAKRYNWINYATGETLSGIVGSVNVEIYRVNEKD